MARAEVLGEEMKVSLGRGDLRVAQHHRQPHDVAALSEIVGSEGVAEAVPSQAREPELVLEQV